MSAVGISHHLPSQAMLGNDDVFLRTMEFLGPRHTCLGLGASCRALRRLSTSNALWRAFWAARCLVPRAGEGWEPRDDGGGVQDVHKAAAVWRHAIRELDLGDAMYAPCGPKKHRVQRAAKAEGQKAESEEDAALLYSAYIQKHCTMKLAQLRLEPFGRQLKTIDKGSTLQRPSCSQTWPGRLSDVVNDHLHGDNYLGYRVMCLNPAEAWCDHPACDRARCGPEGCLRCHRFLPRDYSRSASGLHSLRECSDRGYDSIKFFKCSFCSVSFCNQHVKHRAWHTCDECQLSSCPDCVGQVFTSLPDTESCNVVTAGKECRRTVCAECTWYVGKEKQGAAGHVPGGEYAPGGAAEIVTRRGTAAQGEVRDWEEVEQCCSKCVKQVEFRWKELAQVQDAFGMWGIMP